MLDWIQNAAGLFLPGGSILVPPLAMGWYGGSDCGCCGPQEIFYFTDGTDLFKARINLGNITILQQETPSNGVQDAQIVFDSANDRVVYLHDTGANKMAYRDDDLQNNTAIVNGKEKAWLTVSPTDGYVFSATGESVAFPPFQYDLSRWDYPSGNNKTQIETAVSSVTIWFAQTYDDDNSRHFYVKDISGTLNIMKDGSSILSGGNYGDIVWNPDNSKLVYIQGNDIKTANHDGTGETTIYTGGGSAGTPNHVDWPWGGSKLFYTLQGSTSNDGLRKMDIDGMNDEEVASESAMNAEGWGVGNEFRCGKPPVV